MDFILKMALSEFVLREQGAYPQLYFHVDRLFVKGDPLERVDRDADN